MDVLSMEKRNSICNIEFLYVVNFNEAEIIFSMSSMLNSHCCIANEEAASSGTGP